jgi:L-alanine-DL-glutamate epimerase-like enolase superfamily enzyme
VVTRRLLVRAESWPIRGSFRISRGAKTAAEVVVVELADGAAVGRGECVPYPRYGETVPGTIAAIEQLRDSLEQGLDRLSLMDLLAAGAARNAVDAALWDLEAKLTGEPVHRLAGLAAPDPVVTAYTLSLDTADAMGAAAAAAAGRVLLKLKLGGEGDLERVRAVRAAAPAARLIADANEAWTVAMVQDLGPEVAALGVEVIEQPLPAAGDEALRGLPRAVPLCADESCHEAATLDRLVGLYDLVNVKLDKTGGLTEALRVVDRARDLGLGCMVGCMLGTSLGMAPALLLAQKASYVDLDGPLLLARDREPGLVYRESSVLPPPPGLWGR